MEKKKSVAVHLLAFGLMAAGAFSCSSSTPKADADAYGPVVTPGTAAEVPPSANKDDGDYGPIVQRGKPVVLVLGPGMGRAFADVGVIRALIEKGVKFELFFGTEMGALLGALYCQNASMNSFEWGLVKIKESLFSPKREFGFFGKSEPNTGRELQKVLDQVFESRDLKQFKIALKVGIKRKDTREAFVITQGRAAQALRAAVSREAWLEPVDWLGNAVVSVFDERPFLVSEAKAMGPYPVIVVSLQGDSLEAKAFEELKKADLILRPQVGDFAETDWNNRSEIAFRGKKAVIDRWEEIRRLADIPQDAVKESTEE